VLAPKLLTESARGNKTKLDVPGAVTVTLALLLLVFGLTTAGEKGWDDTLAWGPLAAGLFLFVVFFFIEKNTAHALVPVTILGRNNIAWGNIAGILAFATETSLVFVLTLYLQQVLGYTPLGAGLAFAVLGIGTVVGGFIAPKLIGKLGNRNTIITGLTIQAAATGPCSSSTPTRSRWSSC
jgi:predicted MFS family arabinose efflux permease